MAGYLKEQSRDFVMKFVSDCLVSSSEKKTKAQLIYDVYVVYCAQMDYPVLTRKAFFMELAKLFFKTESAGRKLYYAQFKEGLLPEGQVVNG